MTELPKLNRGGNKAKISVYVSVDVGEVYRAGKHNGWDVCEISRLAVEKALREAKEQLLRKAK